MSNEFDKNRARQGRSGTPVLVVLLVALALAALVWNGVEMYGEQIAPAPQDRIDGAAATPSAPAQEAPSN